MKKINFVVAAAFALSVSAQAHQAPAISAQALSAAAQVMGKVKATSNMINWAIGDFHNFTMEMEGMGALGSGHKEVTKEEPAQNAFWYVQKMDVMGQAQNVETLMSRADGKVLRQIVNGEEKAVGGGDDAGNNIEIIEQSETEVTVPAGKFDCMYIKAKFTQDGQTQEVELWVNPIDVNLDGMLKMVMQSQFGPIAIILQDFGPKK